MLPSNSFLLQFWPDSLSTSNRPYLNTLPKKLASLLGIRNTVNK